MISYKYEGGNTSKTHTQKTAAVKKAKMPQKTPPVIHCLQVVEVSNFCVFFLHQFLFLPTGGDIKCTSASQGLNSYFCHFSIGGVVLHIKIQTDKNDMITAEQ